MIEGEFRILINIPYTFGTIKDVRPKYDKNEKTGEITLIYSYCINNENVEIDL